MRLIPKILKYLEVAKISILTILAYPFVLVGQIPIFVLVIIMISQLYTATYTTTNTTQFNGLTLSQVVWLLMLVQAFRASKAVQKASTIISEEVITGTLSYTINKSLFLYFISLLGIFSKSPTRPMYY